MADTNTVISGLLWNGNPRRILEAARTGKIQLFTSLGLLAEIDEVLRRPKFARRLTLAEVTPRELVLGYAALAHIVEPVAIEPVVLDDPDDDAVLACALAAQAEVIVTGDSHLLLLEEYDKIPIVTAALLCSRLRV